MTAEACQHCGEEHVCGGSAALRTDLAEARATIETLRAALDELTKWGFSIYFRSDRGDAALMAAAAALTAPGTDRVRRRIEALERIVQASRGVCLDEHYTGIGAGVGKIHSGHGVAVAIATAALRDALANLATVDAEEVQPGVERAADHGLCTVCGRCPRCDGPCQHALDAEEGTHETRT